MVTDVEVLQEILHRYTAINRSEAIQPAFDLLLAIADEALPVELTDVELAKQVALGGYGLSAREALRVAVMKHHEIDAVMSFDRCFDTYSGVARLA